MTENPVYTYLSGPAFHRWTAFWDFPHGSTSFLTTSLHCEVCFPWLGKYF